MTFPHAALIHKRRQHTRRRIIPALTLTAAALTAAVLFLATAGAARADSDNTQNTCDGLTSVVLTASSAGTVSGSSAAPSADCDFSVEVRHTSTPATRSGPSGASVDPCVVTATPSASGDRGAKVTATHSGNCNGVEARWTVRPSGPATNHGSQTPAGTGFSGASSTNAGAYALLEGYDNEVFKILMFENRSRAYWVSTATSIQRASHYPSQRGYPTIIAGEYLGDGWSVTHAFPQLTALSSSLYEASNSADFTIDVPWLPDPYAQTRADLYLLPAGLFACSFQGRWFSPYPGFHYDTYCRFAP